MSGSPEERRTAHFDALAPRVRAMWGKTSISQLARKVGSSRGYVVRVAAALGLPPDDTPGQQKVGVTTAAQPRPSFTGS